MKAKKYSTSLQYMDRRTKADYVFDKYKSVLKQSVLDVGADAMYLKPKVEQNGGRYLGVGFGEHIDIEVDLEKPPFKFENNSFDTVVCLDVLEHLESIHAVFDEICRISKKYLIVSLPNPWSDFFTVLLKGDYSPANRLKFYGLPVQAPGDRHRWFFSEYEAIRFIDENACRNGFTITQFDTHNAGKPMGGRGLRATVGRLLFRSIFRRDILDLGLHHGTLWFALEKR